LRTIAIIRGRPTVTAEAQRGLVLAAGHAIWFEETTTTRCIAAGRRAGEERIGRITWTLDDAKRAGLAGGQAWRSYPAEMLRARAWAAPAGAMSPAARLGTPATEEVDDEPDNGRPADSPPAPPPDDAPTPAPAGRTRRRRTPAKPEERPPVAPTPPADPQPEPEIPPEPLATGAQTRQIFALMRDVGLPAEDREGRLAHTGPLIGRPIESSAELTLGEAGQVIEDLERVKALPADDRPAALQDNVAARDGQDGPDGEDAAGDAEGSEDGRERPPPDL